MDENEVEFLCTALQERVVSGVNETVRTAVQEAMEGLFSAGVAPAQPEGERKGAEIGHLVRLCDELGVIRAQLESRAGRRRRYRHRWGVEINMVTRLIGANLDRLAQLGVTPMAYPDRVDYSVHQPVHVYATCDPSKDGRIVEVYRPGYLRDGRPWRLMQVAVMACRPAVQEQTPTEKENQ
jgi:hypothetical protein